MDVEDLKDEILDDLEEEALQAESSSDYKYRDNRNEYQPSPSKYPAANHNRQSSSRNNYEDDEDIVMLKNPINNNRGSFGGRNRDSQNNSDYNNHEFNRPSEPVSNDLGATNHMQSRINSLEKYEFDESFTRIALKVQF